MVLRNTLLILTPTTLTSKNLALLYTACSKMAPFDKIKMPTASKVKFIVIKNPDVYGFFDEEEMAIELSSEVCGHFTTILSTLLHEMTHLALYVQKNKDFDKHGPSFQRLKNVYAELYNLDPKSI